MAGQRQERDQGMAGDGGGHNTAIPGPMPDLAGLVGQSQSAAAAHSEAGHGLMLGDTGAGAATSGGDMWEWDSGLAVFEQPGEA